MSKPDHASAQTRQLTNAEQFAICVAAGVPIATSVSKDGRRLTLSTVPLCGIAEVEPGRFIVYTRMP